MYPTVQYENNIFRLDPMREYIGRSRGTNAERRLVRFITYIIIWRIGPVVLLDFTFFNYAWFMLSYIV